MKAFRACGSGRWQQIQSAGATQPAASRIYLGACCIARNSDTQRRLFLVAYSVYQKLRSPRACCPCLSVPPSRPCVRSVFKPPIVCLPNQIRLFCGGVPLLQRLVLFHHSAAALALLPVLRGLGPTALVACQPRRRYCCPCSLALCFDVCFQAAAAHRCFGAAGWLC
ncbi:hypothetical protein GQ54DRAFT_147389 [Martensiomyces pterosporus]|nr:hypothetical protein GQ54DRAFT_147389 [Martensiomyces pterosporus]